MYIVEQLVVEHLNGAKLNMYNGAVHMPSPAICNGHCAVQTAQW